MIVFYGHVINAGPSRYLPGTHCNSTGFPANRIEKVTTVLDLSMAPA